MDHAERRGGSIKGWGYLLYYATNFVFTGLAVAVAFHAGLFNIGGEGQAYVAGAGAAFVGLGLEFLPWPIVIPLAILAAMAVGSFWAWVPGVLQVKRGSHIVITTIMFNYIALSLMGYLINYWFRPVGKMAVESREITGAYIMSFREVAREFFDMRLPSTPLNFTVFLAIAAAVVVWYLLWRTKLGYEIRAVGANTDAAVYAGIRPDRIIVITMAISGALAGLMAINEILGAQHRLVLGFVQGAGFVGIAVALMGRSHPLGNRSRRHALRTPLSRRYGTLLCQARDQPRHDRRHPGAGDPVHGRARICIPSVALGSVHQGEGLRRSMDLYVEILASTIRYTVPLILACIAGLWSERSGIVDIGLEGKMLIAAFIAASASRSTVRPGSACSSPSSPPSALR